MAKKQIVFTPTQPFSSKVQENFYTAEQRQDFLSALAFYGRMINVSRVSTGSNTLITHYTLPAGKTFFLCSLSMYILQNGTNANENSCMAIRDAVNTMLLEVAVPGTAGTMMANSCSYSLPFRMNTAGDIIASRQSTSNCRAFISITGYEVDTLLLSKLN